MRLDKENQGIRPPGRERSAVESRRLGGPAGEIMLAARTLFERRGVGKTTVKDIAAEANVTRELVYYYFENKQAVVDAVLDDYVEDLVESVIVWNESRRFGDTSGSLRACIATFRRALYDAEGNQRPMIAVLEELGVRVERDKIAVDEHYRTNVEGVYAVGDIVPGPALAHVASAEALHCVEHICGVESDPVDYSVIPSCVFTSPEVASVGLTEREALAREIPYTVGRYSFMASGKAAAAGERDGRHGHGRRGLAARQPSAHEGRETAAHECDPEDGRGIARRRAGREAEGQTGHERQNAADHGFPTG